MTLNLSEAKNHGCRPHLRGSVRRASGFVLTGKREVVRNTFCPPLVRDRRRNIAGCPWHWPQRWRADIKAAAAARM